MYTTQNEKIIVSREDTRMVTNSSLLKWLSQYKAFGFDLMVINSSLLKIIRSLPEH